MGLLDSLFGSGPKVRNIQRFGAQDVVGDVQGTLAPFVSQMGQGIGQQVLGGSAAFGPGFQGTLADAFARAQTSNLLNFLNTAGNIRAAGTETVVDPGRGGLFGPLLGGIAGGIGTGLGAKILGLGGGGEGAGVNSFLNNFQSRSPLRNFDPALNIVPQTRGTGDPFSANRQGQVPFSLF